MSCPKSHTSLVERQGVLVDMHRHPAGRRREEPSLQCVSSGYMSEGCSCPQTIPASIVTAAWLAELDRGGIESRLFHVAWRGAVWLAVGLEDGQIRGVYCPAHRAQREARFAGCEAQHYAPRAASA
jgi:hypothetical protein